MRTVRVMLSRTFGFLAGSFSSLVGVAVFLAVSGGLFAKALLDGEGGVTPVAVLWATSAASMLPVLAAMLTMRLVADERTSGRLELLLSAPVRERDVVVGKFLGAWFHALLALAVYLLVPLVLLPFMAPSLEEHLSLRSFAPAFAALGMQSALWCACGLLASVCFHPSAVAAVVSMLLTVVLPYAAYQSALTWMRGYRLRLSEMPFTVHIVDMATGLVHLSVVAFYVVLTAFALFAAAKALALMRLRGRGFLAVRLSSAVSLSLGLVFSVCAIAFVGRFRLSADISPVDGFSASDRTRQILAETSGETVEVTCFLSRGASEYMAARRLLRGLEATARGVAGVRLDIRAIDPRWDLGDAERLVKSGVAEGTFVFRRGRRRVAIPVSDIFGVATNGVVAVSTKSLFEGESVCASAIQRLSVAGGRRGTVYCTVGHGETSASSYDAQFGMSDLARELRQDGYRVKDLDLVYAASIPDDCAVLLVAGAREPFSRTELLRLDGYLHAGGRMLVLTSQSPNAGVGSLLADWGVRQLPFMAVSPSRTFSGSDMLVSDLGGHAVTRPLAGCTLFFENASVLVPASDGTNTLDRAGFTALARTGAESWGESDASSRPWVFDPTVEPKGPLVVAAALERGGGAAKDLAFRPTRIVVVGDSAFAVNGALKRRANANRDFLLNAVAWLAGLDAVAESRTPDSVVATGLDRSGWVRFGLVAALGPASAMMLLAFTAAIRRRKGA